MSLDEIIEELRECNYSHFDEFYNETKKTVFFAIIAIIKDRDLFLRVSKAERLRSGCQPGQVLVKAFFHVADCSLCPHRTEGELASCLAASFQGTSPIHEGSTLMT